MVALEWSVPSLMCSTPVLADCITHVGLDAREEGIVLPRAAAATRSGNMAESPTRRRLWIAGSASAAGSVSSFGSVTGAYRTAMASNVACRRMGTNVVVAPSLIPKRANKSIKTDRRDTGSLARLHRAGELTAV